MSKKHTQVMKVIKFEIRMRFDFTTCDVKKNKIKKQRPKSLQIALSDEYFLDYTRIFISLALNHMAKNIPIVLFAQKKKCPRLVVHISVIDFFKTKLVN